MTDFKNNIAALYKSLEGKHQEAREHFDGPLTLAPDLSVFLKEKIFYRYKSMR